MISDTVSRYCLDCRNSLREISDDACPECGRGFDPDDSTTFAVRPKRPSRWPVLLCLVGMWALLGWNLARLGLTGWRVWDDLIGAMWFSLFWLFLVMVVCGPVPLVRHLVRGIFLIVPRDRDEARERRDLLRSACRLCWIAAVVVFLITMLDAFINSGTSGVVAIFELTLIPLFWGVLLAETVVRPLGAASLRLGETMSDGLSLY